jgi:hypothetical protein
MRHQSLIFNSQLPSVSAEVLICLSSHHLDILRCQLARFHLFLVFDYIVALVEN